MFWHTYKFVNSWNSSKWNEFEQRHFELSQKHKNALLQELSLSKVLKDLHVSQDTVCQNWQIFPKWSDKCKIHNMDYIRNIFQACFRTRSILAELHVLPFVSKSYPSSLIKSRYALLCLVLTQNCVFRWGNRRKSSCPRNQWWTQPENKFFDRGRDSLQSDTGYGTRLTQRNKKFNDFRANLCAY